LKLFVEGEIYGMLETLQTFDLYMIAIAEVNEVLWFCCVAFYGGRELEFFSRQQMTSMMATCVSSRAG
jgi:hypothetical protein